MKLLCARRQLVGGLLLGSLCSGCSTTYSVPPVPPKVVSKKPLKPLRPLSLQRSTDLSPAKKVPTVVRSRVPHGGIIRFCGSEKLGHHGNNLLINFYSLPSKTDNYAVDVFISNFKKGRKYRFVQTIKVPYTEFANLPSLRKFDHIFAQMMWLDPRSKKIPVLKLKCFADGFSGPVGNNFIIIFKKGLTRTPFIQQFSYGENHDGAYFNYLDDRDVMMVTILETSTSSSWTTYLKWNGKRFNPWKNFRNW